MSSNRRSMRFAIALISLALLLGATGAGKAGKKTHLGTDALALVNLQTFNIPNDNSGGHQFYYDRDIGAPFTVPEKLSFVVTDVIVHLSSFDANNFYLVVVNFDNQGYRTFSPSFSGQALQHYSFETGFVVPAGHTPTARNTGLSNGAIEVQLLGYFIKSSGPPPGEVLFE